MEMSPLPLSVALVEIKVAGRIPPNYAGHRDTGPPLSFHFFSPKSLKLFACLGRSYYRSTYPTLGDD